MGGTGSNSSVYIDRLYTDAFGGVHIRNPQIRGFDAGISHGRDETAGSAGIRLKGSAPIDVRGGTITQNDVGIESLAGGKAVIGGGVNVLNNNVTDFAYEAGSAVKVIDAYASRLFDLTHGSFRTADLRRSRTAPAARRHHPASPDAAPSRQHATGP